MDVFMRMALQLLITGISLGSFYTLIAMGFSIIFGVTRAFNLAHGEMILLGGYLAYTLHKFWHFPLLATLPISMAALFLAAILLHALLRKLHEPFEMNSLVVTFGLALLLQNLLLLGFSADYRLIPVEGVDLLHLPALQLTITQSQGVLIGLSLAATGAVHLLLRKTFLGKALRATIQDREAAALVGIDVTAMNRVGFAFGGLFIGLAGPLFGQITYLHPAGGMEATVIAVVITIFAGVGRTRTILLGGWLLGMAESVAAFGLGSNWREGVSALLLIGLLMWKPRGILSHVADQS
jgi:branched-chain amino acid transport system permease protein